MKSIYNEYLVANTEEGKELYQDIYRTIQKIFKKYEAKGCSAREISHEVITITTCIEAACVIKRMCNLRKVEKEKETKSHVSNN